MTNNVQSIYADRMRGWTPELLYKWIRDSGFMPIKQAHVIGNQIRFRIRMPDPEKRYYTYVLKNGVHLVIEK